MNDDDVQSAFPFLSTVMPLPLQPDSISQIPLQILQPVPHQIPQLPFPHVNLGALLDQVLDLTLQLTGDDIPSSLSPGRFGDLLLHGLDLDVLLLQRLPKLDQVASQALLLRFHVLPDVLLALLEALVNDGQQPLPQALELVRNDTVHPRIKILNFYVDIRYLVTHLHSHVLQTLLRLDTRGLETSTVRHQPRPNLVGVIGSGNTGLTQTGPLFEILQ